MNKQHEDEMLSVLERIAIALESKHQPYSFDFERHPDAIAFRWRSLADQPERRGLTKISSPSLISFDELTNISSQKQRIYQNTQQFLYGLPANNVLLSGARGTGKSSLVKACLAAFHTEGLRLIEVSKDDLDDLPDIIETVADRPERFIIFCDDLSFEENEYQYKGLKTVLDGSTSVSSNVLIYATSNRRHITAEKMADNLTTKTEEGEVRPSDAIEEKIALSERFGLALLFYSFTQDEYMAAVFKWLSHFNMAVSEEDADLQHQAIQWATQRGGRSGRIAYQFVSDYVGKQRLAELNVNV
jgi:hypothetical protein